MSPIPTIAVTGINGFIATELVLFFLSRNWHVRGSVRTSAQADKLKTHPAYKAHIANGRLEVVVVEDLAKGDLGELLEGVEAVASVAAPLPKMGDSSLGWEDYKRPTVEPILRILHYAKKSTTIKSVLLMSSLSSSMDLESPPGKVYTEDDWNSYTEETCKAVELDKNPMAPVIWYFTAKKLAEQAVLEFQKTEKPAFSISTFCPSMVTGPAHFLASAEDVDTLGDSQKLFLALFAGKDQPLPPQFSATLVDVRDMAEAFYLGVSKRAEGKFIISGPEFTYQQLADKLRTLRPDLEALFPLGEPGNQTPYPSSIDATKSKEVLGLQYHTIEETLVAAVEFYEKLGLFNRAPGGDKA
ncbi:hypothetical protein IAR50_006916 [Cryptococcus sp. DSM 104548]